MIFRKIKKTYRKYFREKRKLSKKKNWRTNRLKSFFLYNINLFHDAYPRWIQPKTSRSIQYPRQCACCRGDKKGVLYVHEFQRREIALSRWRGEISIFFAAISKTLLTPRDTNDSYPMPDSMARVISRFLHVRASTVDHFDVSDFTPDVVNKVTSILTCIYIYKLPSYISGSLYKNRH